MVTMWGRRSTGSPATVIPGTSPGRVARIRSTRPESRADSSAACGRRYSRAAAAAAAPGMSGNPPTQPRSGLSAGRQRCPERTTSTPTPAGPPQSRAEAARTSHPSGTASRPITWIAWTRSGTSAARVSWLTPASGWRVPTSPLAACTHTRAAGCSSSRARPVMSTRPQASTGTVLTSPDHLSTGMVTAMLSTAVTTARRLTAVRDSSSPWTATARAVGPEDVRNTSAGPTPRLSARLARAASRTIPARRPSWWRRAGSDHDCPAAARQACCAAGRRGCPATASR